MYIYKALTCRIYLEKKSAQVGFKINETIYLIPKLKEIFVGLN